MKFFRPKEKSEFQKAVEAEVKNYLDELDTKADAVAIQGLAHLKTTLGDFDFEPYEYSFINVEIVAYHYVIDGHKLSWLPDGNQIFYRNKLIESFRDLALAIEQYDRAKRGTTWGGYK
jgi:hypothetical protein